MLKQAARGRDGSASEGKKQVRFQVWRGGEAPHST